MRDFLRRRLGDVVLLALVATLLPLASPRLTPYWLDFVIAYILAVFALYAVGKGGRVERVIAVAAIIAFVLVELRILR